VGYTARRSTNKVILVTGAGGVVGSALIQKLTDSTLICLTHKRAVEGPNVVSEPGDIRLPRLGLSQATYDDVAGGIDCIVHSAAITDFTKTDDIADVNVDGTRRVLDLAARAGVPIYHLSTAYVISPDGLTPYEESKLKGEALVKQSGLPATIIRPSVILGDARTGEIARFQGFYFLIDLFVKGLLPFIPASPSSYIDFVPQDFVADTIAALIERDHVVQELWLTAGTRALTLEDIVAFCLDQMPALTGRTVDRPHMISMETYQRLFKPVFFDALSQRQQKFMARAMYMVKYLNRPEALPSDSPGLEHVLDIPPMPDPRQTLGSALGFWARNRGLLAQHA
jgi:nucleoside-diphosphate-sugar epimerase